MRRVEPAPVNTSLVIVVQDPLESLKVLLHHDSALLNATFFLDIEATLLEIVLAFGGDWVLLVQRHEGLDEFPVILFRLGINIGLRRHKVSHCGF